MLPGRAELTAPEPAQLDRSLGQARKVSEARQVEQMVGLRGHVLGVGRDEVVARSRRQRTGEMVVQRRVITSERDLDVDAPLGHEPSDELVDTVVLGTADHRHPQRRHHGRVTANGLAVRTPSHTGPSGKRWAASDSLRISMLNPGPRGRR